MYRREKEREDGEREEMRDGLGFSSSRQGKARQGTVVFFVFLPIFFAFLLLCFYFYFLLLVQLYPPKKKKKKDLP